MSEPRVPESSPTIETLRVHQANERTMLAWIRTGIALMAFGFAIARFGLFLRQVEAAGHAAPAPAFGSSGIGVGLVAAGFLTNTIATVRFARVRRDIEQGRVGTPSATLVYVLGATISLVGLAMIGLIVRAVAW